MDHSHSSAIYIQVDEKLKMVLMGRDQKDLSVKEPAFFSSRAISWTHTVGNANWNYTLEASTGVLTWGPADPLLQKKDECRKVF